LVSVRKRERLKFGERRREADRTRFGRTEFCHINSFPKVTNFSGIVDAIWSSVCVQREIASESFV
ncbi:unnamed protein product, partial [Arabidopsis halleri]